MSAASVTCTHPECDEEIDVEFDYEPAEPQTWMEPGWLAGVSVNEVTAPCGCEQDDDRLEELLLEWMSDRYEDGY